jgi:choline kinase
VPELPLPEGRPLMQAVILAAGGGSRLGADVPKCLVGVGGQPLLEHQLDALEQSGVDEVTVVVGHQHEQVRDAVGRRVRLVRNARYAETNSLYSFWLARQAVEGELVLLNSDVLFPSQLLGRLLSAPGSALAFDTSSGEDDEHMKVLTRRGHLQRMSKALPPDDTDGENVGVIRLSASAADAAFEAAGWLVQEGCLAEWVGAAITDVAPRHPIACLDVADLPWVEIDFPEDLELARDQVWPAIEALDDARPAVVDLRDRVRAAPHAPAVVGEVAR